MVKKNYFKLILSIVILFSTAIIAAISLNAAVPDVDFNQTAELRWFEISAEEEYFSLGVYEIYGTQSTIPAIADYTNPTDMRYFVAYNGVNAIYETHNEAYLYWVFDGVLEEVHFYNYKFHKVETVAYADLVDVRSVDIEIPIVQHTVSFYNEDVLHDVKTVLTNRTVELPDDPEKENHVFVGWYSDPLFYYAYDPSTVIVNSFSLYAKFQLEDLNINYFNGDLLYTSRSVIYGEKNNNIVINPSVNDYIKKMYSYVGGEDFIEYFANEDLILMNDQQWIIKQKGKSPFVSSGFKPYLDETILQTSFSNSIKKISLTLSSQKSDTSAMVHTSIDGGSFNVLFNNFFQGSRTWVYNFENDIKHIQIWGRVITIDEIILYEGYNFSGKKYIFDKWYYDEELTLPYYEDDVFYEDTNLYAGYVEKKFELSFNSNGGSPVTSQFYYEDDEISLPKYNPSKIGYVFAGWYLDEEFEEEFNLELMPGDDVVLYAKWEETQAVQYLIEFYLDEELYTYIVIEEEQQLILPATPEKEDHVFLGWYYDEDFEFKFSLEDEITEDLILYGNFSSDSGGGSAIDDPDEAGFKPEYVVYAVLGVVGLVVIVGLIKGTTKKRKRK